MSKLSQRAATFAAICSVTGQSEYTEQCVLNKDQKASVIGIISEGFIKGEIELADTPSNNNKLVNPPEMKKYVTGLVDNWLRKDENLNGGVKYQAKNPGSRAGQGDEKLKTYKALRAQFAATGETAKVAVMDGEITKRTAEIAAEKASERVAKIDLSTLSAETRKLLGLE